VSSASGEKILILSDGKPGHLNQSIAFARLLGLDYDLVECRSRSRWAKAASYLLDRCRLRSSLPFTVGPHGKHYAAVASAGSETYYANKVLARQLGAKAVAIMLPSGYRLDFDLIVAQEHDRPPQRSNLLALPVNLAAPVASGVVEFFAGQQAVGVVIGGPSRHFELSREQLRGELERIFALFPQADLVATTSRRTPAEVEDLVAEFPFRRAVLFHREPVNPIPDFLAHCQTVFVTGDSTSMVSEAVSFGQAEIEVLPLVPKTRENKILRMLQHLEELGYLHTFDGHLGHCRRKVDQRAILGTVWPCA
jgi:uncharacterized protein